MVKKLKVTSRKFQAIVQLLMLAGILMLLNVISTFVFTRFDLTEDKRFTLSDNTRRLMGGLKDVVYIKVYLEGDFSPAFARLRQSTVEILDEMRLYANGNLEYEFIDPSANPDEEERRKLYAQLYQKGIQPTTVEERTNEGVKRSYVFPGALVSYSNMEMSVQLLKNQIGFPPEQVLNNSIQNLEFEFCNAIRKVTDPARPVVAFLEGHGELDTTRVMDFSNTLRASYDIKRLTIGGRLDALESCKALIVAQPKHPLRRKINSSSISSS